MKKVFLSHSSKDKDYVRKVVEKIGIDNCVFDEYTFEDGMKTLDEIYKGLELTDIFVLFISDNSLESKWVKKEHKRAKSLLDEESLSRFYPIIIDNNIKYNDERIPQWMSNTYNIRCIAAPTIAANKIKSRMREIVWNSNPKLKKRNHFFIGRNDEIKLFEERRADFDSPELKCVVASSGFDGMGRKSFITHVLKKGNVMNDSYEYNLISLEKHESIEDFILKVADLGFKEITVSELSLKNQDEKIELAISIVNEIGRHNEFVFINDQGVIIRPNSQMVDWFVRILEQIDNKIIFGIASIYSLHTRNSYYKDEYSSSLGATFSVRISELSVIERKLLLKEWCNIESINITPEQMKIIASNLSGYPEQVFYAIQMVKEEGINKTINQIHDICSFADSKAQVIFDNYVNTDEKIKFLAFLSSFDFVSYEILEVIFQKHECYKKYLESFLSISICEYIGSDSEYIKVNDVLKDIVFRRKLSMGDELNSLFDKIVDKTVNDNFVNETDLASYYAVVRSKIENGNIDEKYVIPSHYLKCIVKNYNAKYYSKSTKLCKQLIERNRLNIFDKEIVNDIYYYYCQSLAREHKTDEFFNAIKFKGFRPEDKEFLLGFFYRITGKPDKAIEHLLNSLAKRPNFPKARRELANAYLSAEEYEKAEQLCLDNYLEDSKNAYYIQPYFESLIHKYINNDSTDQSENINIMNSLLKAMANSDAPQSKQMYICMSAEYYAYVKHDFDRAMLEIQSGLTEIDDSKIYLYLTKFDIAYKNSEIEIMKKTLDEIEDLVQSHDYFLNALKIRKARYYSSLGEKTTALNNLKKINNMPPKTIEKFENEINSLLNNGK